MSNSFSGLFAAGNKPEVKTLNGYKVLRFNAANTVGYGDKKKTVWVSVSSFQNVDNLAGLINVGSKMFITGELTKREYEGKTYLELNARSIDIVGGKNERDSNQPRQATHNK